MAREILVTWEINSESTFVLVAWEKLLACIGGCQNLQRQHVLVLTLCRSARPDHIAAETESSFQAFQSPFGDVLGDL